MKKIFFILVLAFIIIAMPSWTSKKSNMNERLTKKILKFNYSNEVDYEGEFDSFFDDKVENMIYLIAMKNSIDKLIAYESENGDLTPIGFIVLSKEKLILKDINNRKITIDADLKKNEIKYLEENDSKYGFALTKKDCLGGSTSACFWIAWDSCQADSGCSLTCTLAGAYCPAAILTACAISCAKADTIEPPSGD